MCRRLSKSTQKYLEWEVSVEWEVSAEWEVGVRIGSVIPSFLTVHFSLDTYLAVYFLCPAPGLVVVLIHVDP